MYNDRQLFKTYVRFDSVSYVDYLKTLHQKFGKIFGIADRAAQNRTIKIRKYLRSNDVVK